MKVDGGCYCGRILFEAEITPEQITICHCTDCQTLSGTAFRISAPAAIGRFRVTNGTPRQFIKTAASGNRRVQAFCGDCGTALYATAADSVGTINIRTGTIRQRDALTPSREIWCRSAAKWMPRLKDRAFDKEAVEQ